MNAAHVIGQADQWRQPIQITSDTEEKTVFLTAEERVVFIDYRADSAVILTFPPFLDLNKTAVELAPPNLALRVGKDLGWMGYPVIGNNVLCFFGGAVSAFMRDEGVYLIDGVAINGVSGGPVFWEFYSDQNSPPRITVVGTMTSYIANQSTGISLPGLSAATDVNHLHSVIQNIRDFKEAQERRQEFDAESANTAPPPTPPEDQTEN